MAAADFIEETTREMPESKRPRSVTVSFDDEGTPVRFIFRSAPAYAVFESSTGFYDWS